MEKNQEQNKEQVSYEITADLDQAEALIADLCSQLSAQFTRELNKGLEVENE